jgi:pyruvate/2-oxoglutarate dehydrogenase complex dihydrolipoamide dehydrogenase (E3) component
MSKTYKLAYMIVPLLAMGCQPDVSQLKQYKVTITNSNGMIHKEKTIYSTSVPTVHFIGDTLMYFDWHDNNWRQNRLPVGWLAEI